MSTKHPWEDEIPVAVETVGPASVMVCGETGPLLDGEGDARDLIGVVMAHIPAGQRWVAIPVSRLGAAFFPLESRVAGDILQKLGNYHIGVAIVGELPELALGRTSVQDFIRESNRGERIWFLSSVEAVISRLAGEDTS
mgnify:CR=1 FL=1